MQNLDTILNHLFYNYSMIKKEKKSSSTVFLANGKNRLGDLKNKSCCGSKTTTLNYFFLLAVYVGAKFFLHLLFYHILMAFIRQMKDTELILCSELLNAKPYIGTHGKWHKEIGFLRCLTDKQALKGNCSLVFMGFRPKVKLESCEMLWEIQQALIECKHSSSSCDVHLTSKPSLRNMMGQASTREDLPVSNGWLLAPQNNQRCNLHCNGT